MNEKQERAGTSKKESFWKSVLVIAKTIKHSASISSPFIAILVLLILFVVIGVRSKTTLHYQQAAQKFGDWQHNAEIDSARGSDIGLAPLFSSARDGFVSLYGIIQEQNIPKSLILRLEKIAVQFKLPILKKTIAVQPERKNYSFRILELHEKVLFSSGNTIFKKSFSFKGRYNKYTSLEASTSSTPSQFSPCFKIYLEPGMSVTDITQLDLNINLEKNGEKTNIPIAQCELNLLGSKEAPSPLIELCVPIEQIRDNQIITLSVEMPEIQQRGHEDEGLIPFSIYDIHVERYALGIARVHTILEFEQKVILESICFCASTLAHRPCSDEEIKIIKPLEYKWNYPVKYFEFELLSPADPMAIAFYRYDL